MRSLYRYSVAHPVRAICAVAAVTLAAVPGLLFLELRTDGQALVPPEAEEVLADRSIRDEFGIEDAMVVLIRSRRPEGIFHPAVLRLVEELTRDIEELDGMSLSSLSSLATEPSDRHRPNSLEYRRLLEPLPATPAECDRLRRDLEALEIFTGTLVSANGDATAIIVGVPPGKDRGELHAEVLALVDGRAEPPESIHVIGAPVAEALLGVHILEDLGVPGALLPPHSGRNLEDGPGMPGSFYDLRRLLGRHLGLVPLALMLMSAVFLFSFRRLAAAALPLVEVGSCLVFLFGLLGWCGVPVYLTLTVMPVILTAVGVADEIHIFSCYRRARRERPGEPHSSCVVAAMDEMFNPIVKTSLTTAVAFLAFAASPIPPVRAFGIFTAAGVLYCLFFSLAAIPALLVLVKPERLVAAGRSNTNTGAAGSRPSLLASIASLAIRHRYVAAGAVLAAAAAAPFGIRQIQVQDSWIDGFHPESEFYQATQFFNDGFFGTHRLALRLDTGGEVRRGEVAAALVGHRRIVLPLDAAGDPERLAGRWITISLPAEAAAGRAESRRRWESWIQSAAVKDGRLVVTLARSTGSPKFFLDLTDEGKVDFEISAARLMAPAVLEKIEDLKLFLGGMRDRGVGGVLAPTDYLATTSFIIADRDPAARAVPQTPREARALWSNYERIRGTKRRRELADDGYERAVVSVFLKNANFADTRRLMADIRDYEREHLTPLGIEVAFAGDVAVSQALIDAVVTTQIRSLVLSLAGVVVTASLLSRSLGWGLYCAVPCSFALLLNFTVMGWLGTPLGVATSMFAGMTLGVGVDYAIHLLERCRLDAARGLDTAAALSTAVRVTGPAILVDAVAVAAGFGVLTLSQVPANARLGAMVLLCVLGCLVATLVLLPALVMLLPPPFPRPRLEELDGRSNTGSREVTT